MTSYCRKSLEMRGLSKSLRHIDNFNPQLSNQANLKKGFFHSIFMSTFNECYTDLLVSLTTGNKEHKIVLC